MKFNLTILAAGLLAASPLFAESHEAEATEPMENAEAAEELVITGNAEAGEKLFRQCAACHVVVNAEGETLAGKASKTGPNLYGVAGAVAGSVEGFKYSNLMSEANEAGIVWTEETFVPYIQDPTGYLTGATGESGRSNMTPQRMRKPEDAADLFAYLHSLASE